MKSILQNILKEKVLFWVIALVAGIIFTLFIGIKELYFTYCDLDKLTKVEGKITSIYEAKLKKNRWFRRTKTDNCLVVVLNDSIKTQLPESPRYNPSITILNSTRNINKQVTFYYKDISTEIITDENGIESDYFEYPYQIDLDSLGYKYVDPKLSIEELEIMQANHSPDVVIYKRTILNRDERRVPSLILALIMFSITLFFTFLLIKFYPKYNTN